MSATTTTTKTINVRLINTHDKETNWLGVESTFTPADGEFIIYSADDNYSYARYKIGDGKTTLDKLPFLNTPVFIGTRNEYNTAYVRGKIVPNTIVYITDDESDTQDEFANTNMVTTLPTPSANYRGRVKILQGATDDDDDVAYVCLKKNGTFGWYPIDSNGTPITL